MSSFMLHDRALSVIVDTVAEYAERGKLPWQAQTTLESINAWEQVDGYYGKVNRKVLFDAIGAFNLERVNIRYPDGEWATVFSGEYTKGISQTPCQQVKQIQCYLYQCSEGNDYESHPMFQLMRAVEYAVLYDIVAALPAYKNADWGNVPETASQVVNILDLL